MPVPRASALAAVLAMTAAVAAQAAAPGAPRVTVPAVANAATSTAVAPVVETPAVPAAFRGSPTALTPLVADFDGDGRSDVLWYGPGALPDHLWLGRAGAQFRGVPVSVRGTYEPVVGDFDGDHRADVLWYGAGSAPDSVWFGRTGGGFTSHPITVGGSFRPLPGDFDGNHRTDVLWYGAGSAPDALWLGLGSRGFASKRITVGGTYRPLLGDFDADGHTDVFWYGAGARADALWYGAGSGTFHDARVSVGGTYEPVVGDFDGDHRRDVLWYGAGTAHDLLWYGTRSRSFVPRAVTLNVAGTPVPGDFDGDGRRDVVVYGGHGGADAAYYGRASHGGLAGVSLTVTATATPVAGDFGGDGRDDVFWYAAGNARDVLWSGFGRGFTGRATTIDIGYTYAPPLRPGVFANQYAPYGLVAHAMGALNGMTYTNTLEAFEANYARGLRVFECDQVVLADGTVVVAHDGTERSYGLDKKFKDAVWADLEGHKYRDVYTMLRAQDLVALLKKFPDAYFILDHKMKAVQAFATYVRLAGGSDAVMEHLIPHVADAATLAGMREAYPVRNYLVALYRTQAYNRLDDPVVLDWARRERIPALMMWFGQRDFSLTLAGNNSLHRRYDARLVDGLKAAGTLPYVHTVDDQATEAFFESHGIGVYTNKLAPPAAPTPTETPTATPTVDASVEPVVTESATPTDAATVTESATPVVTETATPSDPPASAPGAPRPDDGTGTAPWTFVADEG